MQRLSAAAIVILILVGSAAVAVPYAKSVQAEHKLLRDKVDAVKAAPPWSETSAPEDCVGHAMDFGAECTGLKQACDAAVPDMTRTCAQQLDLGGWCEGHGDAIHTTGFGFQDCEVRLEHLTERKERRRPKKHCAAGWRALADLCRGL